MGPDPRRRSGVRAALAAGALAGLALATAGGCGTEPARSPNAVPGVDNVLLVSIDTLRPDYLTPYGAPADATPSVARLADRATLFEDVLAQGGSTAISHKSIFYSLYPAIHKTHVQQRPREEVESPIEVLRRSGWRTAAFVDGGQMHPQYGFGRGFERYEVARDDPDVIDLGRLEKLATDWLEEVAGERFFLFLHTYQVHATHEPPAAYQRRFTGWYEGGFDPRGKIGGELRRMDLGDDEVRLLRDLYRANLAYVDDFLGRLWRRLEDLGLFERTMIVLLSDHGQSLGEGGRFGHNRLFQDHLRIPLVLRLPGAPPGRVAEPVEAVDVMPTVFAALGLEPPFEFQGRSLLPLVLGRQGWRPKTCRIAQQGKFAAVERRGWKLVFHRERPGPGKLYNLTVDPEEREDLAAAFPQTAAELRGLYDAQMAAAAGLAERFVVTDDGDPSAREEVRRELEALGYLN